MIRAVLFDATGTLIEPREPVGETYARVAAEHGVSLPASRLGEAFARILRSAPEASPGDERAWWRDVVRGTFRAADSTARFEDFDAFFDALWRVYASAGAWRVREGVADALRRLRARGVATAVVSNFDDRLPDILEVLGLRELLDAVVLPGDAGARKPSPDIFERALAQLSVPARDAVFVGDDEGRDLAGARAAGLRAVHVRELATLGAP